MDIGRRLSLWCLVVSSVPLPCSAAELVPPTKWRVAGTWRQQQGLPQDAVTSLVFSTHDRIWIGTRGGLARFDGVRFDVFDDRRPDQMRESEVWALLEAKDTSLWIGI